MEAKSNQKKLLNQIKKKVFNSVPIDTHFTKEKSRGRTECRYYEIYTPPKNIDLAWIGIQRVIHVHRFGQRPDKSNQQGFYNEQHFYICSYPFNSALKIAKGIRGHWGIENKIHYVKDTHFKEDDNLIRNNNAAAICSIFQDIAINIYRCSGFSSIKKATIFFANKVNELFKFLSAKHISDI